MKTITKHSLITCLVFLLCACGGGPLVKINGPYNGSINSPIAFSSLGTTDLNGSITLYLWDFGDGNTSQQANPSHTYASIGTYTVTLTVTDNDGKSNTAATVANISEGNTGGGNGDNCEAPIYNAGTQYNAGDIIQNVNRKFRCDIAGWCSSTGAWAYEPGVGAHWEQAWTDVGSCDGSGGGNNGGGNQAPVAQANGPYSGTVNDTIEFSSAGSTDSDGQITSYQWSFGDGSTSVGANPSHSYSNAGNYTVTLIVTDNQGANHSDTATVSVAGGSTGGGNNTGNNISVGYFAEWAVYGRNYHVKNIHTSGSADKLTHIMYAFGNVQNGECKIGDSYAAYDKFYSAADSVNGVADTWDSDALRGNFGQLRRLKQMYPHIKIVWSFGGWTWSGGFTQAAANPAHFAESCYNLIFDPRWADVFDGIDIDWEYPNSCGLTCDNSGFSSYRNLTQALRNRFGNKLVTSAIGAGEANINAADYGGAAQYLDFYMLMTYDYFGSFVPQGPTAPHSALHNFPEIPTSGFYSDYSLQTLMSKGVPASKVALGIGFYGRGWTGVTQNAPGGSATGKAPGTYEGGIEDYKVLKESCPANGTVGGTAYAHCGNNWWSYDTPATIAGKMNYVKQQGMAGAFFWELSGDTADGELIDAINQGLK